MKVNRHKTLRAAIMLLALVICAFLIKILYMYDLTFLLGFSVCLILVLVGFTLFLQMDKSTFLSGLFMRKPTEQYQNNRAYNTLTSTIVFTFIGLLLILAGTIIYNQNKMLRLQIDSQNKQVEQQSQLVETIRKSGLVSMMSNILVQVDEELKESEKNTLSDNTITRLAAISHSFASKDYHYFEVDSPAATPHSKERGLLLKELIYMDIDSGSFEKIKEKVSFKRADLEDAELARVNLSNADLEGANFRGANLEGANFNHANLKGSYLWGANLKHANLVEASLNRADLRWVELDSSDMRMVDLNSADLSHGRMENVNLKDSKLQWANLSGAFLMGSNFEGSNLFGADLSRSNLGNTNLSKTDLRFSDLSESNLRQSILTESLLFKTVVYEKDWLLKLDKWQISGAKEIQTHYKIIDGYSASYQFNYMLMTINN